MPGSQFDTPMTDLRPHLPAGYRAGSALLSQNISNDSRSIEAGDCFLALANSAGSGAERYLAEACERGAAWVLVDSAEYASWGDKFAAYQERIIAIDGLQAQAPGIVRSFYQHPERDLRLIGVTGTNGKSSTSHFLAQALNWLGERCALIGTLGTGLPGQLQPGALTTPDAIALTRILADLRAQAVSSVCMEVSSHALAQDRVTGLAFAYALFSNLSQDHLDYHGSMANYAECKSRLLRWPGLRARIINIDDAYGLEMYNSEWAQDGRSLSVSLGKAEAGLHGRVIERDSMAYRVRLSSGANSIELRLPLIGRFNVSNALLSAGALQSMGYPLADIAAALAELTPVPGRMQVVSRKPMVIVDFAHTPDALAACLQAIREFAGERRVWLVFGCGGERDSGKRALMGEVAARYADHIIVTSDNPRNEDADKIIDAIYQSPALRAHQYNQRCVQRAVAIETAISSAPQDAIVLLAGKGHERQQIIGDTKIDFDDVEIARACIKKL